MAEAVEHRREDAVALNINGIELYLYLDGTIRFYLDPDKYDFVVKPGRTDGQSGRLLSSVIISPVTPRTNQLQGHNRPTDLTPRRTG